MKPDCRPKHKGRRGRQPKRFQAVQARRVNALQLTWQLALGDTRRPSSDRATAPQSGWLGTTILRWAGRHPKVGHGRQPGSGMFFAPHCDPHDSGPPLGLRYHLRSVGKHPTHRSKSWEELAKRRAWSRRPSHQARRKSKAGENSLRAGVGPALFLPTTFFLLCCDPPSRYRWAPNRLHRIPRHEP